MVLAMRKILIYKGEDNYWIAECPSLPGCISQGKNKKEARKNIEEAIEAYLVEADSFDLALEQASREILADFERSIKKTASEL